jgi:hypothetical protein
LARGEFEEEIREFEDILQKVAGEIASGMLSEKLPPSELLKKAENHVNRLRDLATISQETMLVLKPERTSTVQSKHKNLIQKLTTFGDILLQNTTGPPVNSRLALEQLKKALTDGADLLFLMREARDVPSPLISAALASKNEAKGSVISIKASEVVQPLIEYMLGRIDEFNAIIMNLEKKVNEMADCTRASRGEPENPRHQSIYPKYERLGQNRKEASVTFKFQS